VHEISETLFTTRQSGMNHISGEEGGIQRAELLMVPEDRVTWMEEG
jgi:hypothetical protein